MSNISPLKVAIIGTGYVAQRRAETLQSDPRTELTLVSGHTPENVDKFCQTFGVSSLSRWQDLVTHPNVDLVVICSINCDHAPMTRLALEAQKHVIVEYPLALTVEEGKEILRLAQKKEKLLHVEHLEILGELHQTLRRYLSELGTVFYAKYTTFTPKRETPQWWNFQKTQFGFPLVSALSRVNRFIDLFGKVSTINCQNRYWDQENTDYFRACLTNARLTFENGIIGEIVYGKGDIFIQGKNEFEIYGDKGILSFKGNEGKLIGDNGEKSFKLGIKRGLFAKDTTMVIDHLFEKTPLYITPEESLYALQVAARAEISAETGQTLTVNN
ncbi:MAG: Gfo/Idh/MocA family protein [Microcystaceae cyanobacterium]